MMRYVTGVNSPEVDNGISKIPTSLSANRLFFSFCCTGKSVHWNRFTHEVNIYNAFKGDRRIILQCGFLSPAFLYLKNSIKFNIDIIKTYSYSINYYKAFLDITFDNT